MEVEARASELGRLNDTLEQRVATQVGEIQRLARLKCFLAPEVAEMITSEDKEELLDSHRRYIACLFCDIRDFTPLSENLEPEEAMEVLQVYHEKIGGLIARSGGTIGFRAGDGVMVFFNDPLPCDHPSLEAARLALAMRDAFAQARRKWERLGNRLATGIGIASGFLAACLPVALGVFELWDRITGLAASHELRFSDLRDSESVHSFEGRSCGPIAMGSGQSMACRDGTDVDLIATHDGSGPEEARIYSMKVHAEFDSAGRCELPKAIEDLRPKAPPEQAVMFRVNLEGDTIKGWWFDGNGKSLPVHPTNLLQPYEQAPLSIPIPPNKQEPIRIELMAQTPGVYMN